MSEDRRTVLHLIHTGGPGGAETVLSQLVEKVDADRWRSVAAVPGGSWLEDVLRGGAAHVVPLPQGRPLDVGLLRRLDRVVRQHRVDVIHSHLFGPAVYGGILSLARRVPVVATIHGSVDLAVAHKWWGIKKRLLRRPGVRLVAVTEALRNDVIRELGVAPEHVTVVPNGIDVDRFSPGRSNALRREHGWTGDEVVIGAVGNVRRPKDYGTLLDAAARLRQRCPGCRFVIVGDTEGVPALTADLLTRRAELGLDDVVVFTGFREDVPETLNGLHIYVMSSSREGLPLALLQAMAVGLPVVATRCGGPDELLTHEQDGLLVPTGDPAALAAALERMALDIEERERLAAAARATVQRRHTLGRMAADYEQLYREGLRIESPAARAVES